jgi:hypothetical protein
VALPGGPQRPIQHADFIAGTARHRPADPGPTGRGRRGRRATRAAGRHHHASPLRGRRDRAGGRRTAAGQLVTPWPAARRGRVTRCWPAPRRSPPPRGKTVRHRLNRSGDRQPNRALHTIVLARRGHHSKTRAYLARRTAQGKTSKEINRCRKRALTRRLSRLLAATTRPTRSRGSRPFDSYRSHYLGTQPQPDDDELGLWLGCALSVVLVRTLVAVVVISHWWR